VIRVYNQRPRLLGRSIQSYTQCNGAASDGGVERCPIEDTASKFASSSMWFTDHGRFGVKMDGA